MRNNIGTKNKGGIIAAIKEKMKFIIGMLFYYPAEYLVGKPADPFEFILDQKAGIYGDFHVLSIKGPYKVTEIVLCAAVLLFLCTAGKYLSVV